MPELSPELRTLRSRIAAHESWGRTPDRAARTANARSAFDDKFLAAANGDPGRAESLRKAYFARLAYKSAQARRNRRDAAENAACVAELRARLAELGGGGDSGT